ncbi:MAG: VWA domain-containing protein [Candidatus Lokiarchaeota archaeon]|nr:VWA domain-containing protein [Candidatus Lokiarchaeota archaeon]
MIAQERGFGLYSVKNGKDIKLAMQSLWLTGQVHTFGARLLVSHVLKSNETEAIEAVYSFMLPREATLRRFYITGEGFSVHSDLRPTQEAEKEYERGIEAGHLSAFSKIYGDGIVNLNVGNIRPEEEITVHLEILAGVESHYNGFRFRFPFTLAPSYHAQAKMIQCTDGQGEIELPEDKFGDVILPTFMKDSDNLHKIGFNLNVHLQKDNLQIASPSHNVTTKHIKENTTKVSLSVENDVPNRDLVLDVHTKDPILQVAQGVDLTGQTSFIFSIPSNEFGETTQKERNFVFLFDRSGSMGGKPMDQAKNALRACISALSETDRFSLVAFNNDVEIFDSLVNGTMENRERLEKFLDGIEARGGTELMHGIKTASSILEGMQGDIMVITDGQVSGGENIMQHAKALSLRLHILGIGAASQDRFISSLARETGGISKFVTPRERIDLVALELFSGIGRPVATDYKQN